MIEAADHYHLKYSECLVYVPKEGWVWTGVIENPHETRGVIYRTNSSEYSEILFDCRNIEYRRPGAGWHFNPLNGTIFLLERKLAKVFRVGIYSGNYDLYLAPEAKSVREQYHRLIPGLNNKTFLYSDLHKEIVQNNSLNWLLSSNLLIIDNLIYWRRIKVGTVIKHKLLVIPQVEQEVRDALRRLNITYCEVIVDE